MTNSAFWRELEGGTSPVTRFVRVILILLGFAALLFTGTINLTWPQQGLLGLLLVMLAVWLDKSSNSYVITLTLMFCSLFSTYRYCFWRIRTVITYFQDPATHWTALDCFFMFLLVFAELYAFMILILGFFQTIWPLRRTPVPLPDDPESWPAVDLLIPTYNEPLNVVRYTALAAMNIDWPSDKLNVYILDDGNREEFRRFAEEAGVGYMTRTSNEHAKAGNINLALKKLHSQFVCIFDSDHVPTRSFLQVTMGWFLRDQNLAMLQTPHHFYSPDPFERNLGQFRVIPNEGELFYGVVQDGNDFWNSTFFCGSCAVMRRTALDEIGGIAVETVTEDAHTSLRMQLRGWNTAYINIPQAAGLATERLSGHVKQRIRWARGMIQVLRTDNPLYRAGLRWYQRFCYFNCMIHFLYGMPRLIFLTAPLIYLILGHTNVPGYWAQILAYALPHLVISSITNSRIQGQHRHSFWNEVYEAVLSPYIFLPTTVALINPKLGEFDVTAKGGVVNRSFFDTRIAQPFLLLLGLNIFGLLMAIPRFFWLDVTHPGTVVMNCIWTLFNVVILGVATAVARESQQRRLTVRVVMEVPVAVVTADGAVAQGMTVDLSTGGTAVDMEHGLNAGPGDSVRMVFPLVMGDAELPATVVANWEGKLRVQFDPLTLHEEEMLTMVLYSRADTWLGWGESREADRPLASLFRIIQLSFYGLGTTFRGVVASTRRMHNKRKKRKAAMATGILTTALALAAVLGGTTALGQGGNAHVGVGGTALTPEQIAAQALGGHDVGYSSPTPGTFRSVFTLADIGVPDVIELHGVDSYHQVYFSVPPTEVVKTATMHLRYHFSPGLIPALSHLKVMLNGTLFATIPVVTNVDMTGVYTAGGAPTNKGTILAPQNIPIQVTRNGNSTLLEATLQMPVEMLARDNQVTFEFIGHYTLNCEDPAHSTLWSRVDTTTTVELNGDLLPLPDDLKLLPLPFFDASVNLHPRIPVVFLSQPSQKAIQAAGIVASWFGVLTDYRVIKFPVSFGTIPSGNAIVVAEGAASLPAALNAGMGTGAGVSMKTNPNDPYGKLLVLSGDNGDDLVQAAQAVSLQESFLQGSSMHIPEMDLPKVHALNDAPRWLRTDKITPMWDLVQGETLQGDGSVPIGVYMRVPPDMYYGDRKDITLRLDYRYNGIPLSNDSSLQVFMNNQYIGSTPLPHTDKAAQEARVDVPVPVVNMRPFSNSLLLKFFFQIAKKGECQDTAPLNLQGAILKSSYLDLQNIPHWIVLPNLELFANAGFPFTRRADLADTTVVMPDTPTTDEVELFLALMAHFGAQTGFPVLRVTVSGADSLGVGSGRDYLVLGTVQDQAALGQLGHHMPVIIDTNGVHVTDSQGFFAPLQHAWWKITANDHVSSGSLMTSGGVPDALIEGMESPYSAGHTVVVIALKDHTVTQAFLDNFLKNSQSSDIANSVAVLHNGKFESYRIGSDVYHVGNLPLLMQISLWFTMFPWAIVLVVIFIAFFLAVWTRVWLRRRARRRLQGE